MQNVWQIVGSIPGRVKPGFCWTSGKHAALTEKAKIGWLGIRIICPSKVTYLPSDCCASELTLYKFN